MPRHKQQTDLYIAIGERPGGLNGFKPASLEAFLAWTVEAIALWPLNDAAKIVLDKIIAHQASRMPYIILDLQTARGFTDWWEVAQEACALSVAASEVMDAFIGYRDRLRAYEERRIAATRNYWTK